MIERYLSNQLSEEDRSRFEEHYFSCANCLASVKALQAARVALLADPTAAPARTARRTGAWLWPALATAAAIVIAIIIGARLTRAPAPAVVRTAPGPAPHATSPDLTELARIEPPRFAPPTERGGLTASDKAFRVAMAQYRAGDYAGALPELLAVTQSNPGDMNARFFLGASYILTGNAAAGMAELNRVVRAGDASPWLEEAHFLLGKAYLGQGDVPAARREFQAVVAMRGDMRDRAAAILNRLPSL